MTDEGQGLRPGDVVFVGRAASVQFTGRSGFVFRIIAVDDRPTYAGWVWLDGYQLDRRGQAVARRRIFVVKAGLRRAGTPGSSLRMDRRH
ncbi:hypothetical protein AB0368_26065 [Actinoplanes sp. NPDC051475]|jgi:hypothetical protein|uniref:hypothetical protein n=1 Tax=Actinoplanes sp. NPDC051475 TaxID=3157225 RepID=UPI00344BE0E7